MMARTGRLLTSVLLLLGTAVSCGESGSDARGDVLQALGAQQSGLETVRVYRSVEEAMPNVDYTLDGRPHHEAQLYVRGEILEVRPGRSFTWPTGDDSEDVAQIGEFNSGGADMSEVLLEVAVADAIGATDDIVLPERATISLGLQAPADLEALRSDLGTGSEIVAILNRWDPFTQQVTATYMPLEGTFIGFVTDSGHVTFPAVEAAGEGDLVPEGLTVEDLESTNDQDTIELRTVHGDVTRQP